VYINDSEDRVDDKGDIFSLDVLSSLRFLGRVTAHDAMISKQVDVPLFGIWRVGDFLRWIEIVIAGVIRKV
jgi:hypothetical protein